MNVFELIFFCFFSALIAFIAGIYSRVTGMSLGLILAAGLYSVKTLFPIAEADIVLPIILATSIATTIPINALYMIQASRDNRIDLEFVTKTITKVALVAIISAQIVGILPVFYMHIFFIIMLLLFSVYYVFSIDYLLKYINKSSKLYVLLLGSLSVFSGNEGREIGLFFAKKNQTIKTNQLFGTYSVIGFFIAFSACIGFVLPAFPLQDNIFLDSVFFNSEFIKNKLITSQIGFINIIMVIYLVVFAFLGLFLMRDHNNDMDSIWLKRAFSVFLLALIVREFI